MPTTSSGRTIDPLFAGGLAAAAGAAGAFPTPTNMTGSGTSVTNGNSSSVGTSGTSGSSQSSHNSNLTGTTQLTNTSTTNPNISPGTQSLIDQLLAHFGTVLNSQPTVKQYVGSGIQNINSTSNAMRDSVNNAMASRGLGMSPAGATAELNVEQNRLHDINQLETKAPQELQNLQLPALNAAISLMGAIPHGTTTTGTSTGNVNQNQSGTSSDQSNQMGYSNNNTTSNQNTTTNQQQQGQSGGGVGGAIGGIASLLAALLG